MKSIDRKLTSVYTPPAHPGFLGRGHVARPVIQLDFSESDPFIMLMDDILEKKDFEPSGGPHPHGGFETVSLVLEGELGDEEHGLKAGDFEMMTAGSGIVHTETIERPTKMRLLQLWLNLPKDQRRALPRVQRLKSERVPTQSADGVAVKVYSGNFAGVTSPVKNHTPIIIADIQMQPGSSITATLPANFSTFLYAITGSLHVGGDEKSLSMDEVGWLDRFEQSGDSQLTLKAGAGGARVVLYSALPQKHEIVSHGPFIADTMDDIRQLYADFRAGKMGHIADVPAAQQFAY